MIDPKEPTFRDAAKQFWLRDYEADVTQMNGHLAKRGRTSAGLEIEPPCVFTGDAFEAPAETCVMSVGINPKLQRGLDGGRTREMRNLFDFRSSKNFDGFAASRGGYFSDIDCYGTYFTRLGGTLRRSFFGHMDYGEHDAQSAAQFLAQQIGKFDLIPWFSENTNDMNFSRACETEPMEAWKGVLKAFVREKKPKAIVINGKAGLKLTEWLFDVDLNAYSSNLVRGGRTADTNTPVAVHGQIGGTRGVSDDDRANALEDWKQAVGYVDSKSH